MERVARARRWFTASSPEAPADMICASRDQFRGRLERLYGELARRWTEEEGALLSAAAGEIGNNCFDHNLGQWRDVPGCWFDYEVTSRGAWIIAADRGQGVLSSLRRVEPALQTDQEALEVAFSKVVSGRSPERRGNGLKFVRRVINGRTDRGLVFLSGGGKAAFGGLARKAEAALGDEPSATGTFSLILGERA